MTAAERGVSIIPLAKVDNLCTEVANSGIKANIPRTPAPTIMLYRFAAKKGLDLNKTISRIGSESHSCWRKNRQMKEKLTTKKAVVKRRDETEKFSAMRFRPNIKENIAPKKREAPAKSI